MADPPPKGRKPTKRLKPSRLRNEIRPESTDDERDPQRLTIQVPHSDTIIPETQLGQTEGSDHRSDYGDDMLLSPNSAAVLKRNAVKKAIGPSVSAPCAITLLTKEALGLGNTSQPSPSFSFSFGHARKSQSKTTPTEGVESVRTASQAKAVDAAVGDPEGQAIDATNNAASSVAHSSRSTLEVIHPACSNTDSLQSAYTLPFPPHVAFTGYGSPQAGDKGSEFLEGGVDTSPSVQPSTRAATTTKNIRTVKKGKSRKRAHVSEPQGGPWPPRSQHDLGYRNRTSNDPNVNCVSTMPTNSHESSRPEAQDIQEHDPVAGCFQASSAVRAYYDDMQSQQNYAGHIIEDTNSRRELVTSKTLDDVAQMATPNQREGSSQCVLSALPENVSVTPAEQPESIVSHQPSELYLEHSAGVTSGTPAHILPEGHSLLSSREGNPVSGPQNMRNALEVESMSAGQSPRQVTDTSLLQELVPQRKDAEAVLHNTTNRSGSHRVSKTRKKLQPTNHSQPRRTPTVAMSSSIDRALEGLRVALLAEQFRNQHEDTTKLQHHEETVSMLRDLVSLQSDAIADWKSRHHDLDSAVVRMNANSKANQDYIAGLQKDYEELKQFAASFHDQSKQTLREKVAEIETEKESLRRDLEVTVDVLSKSQENMKATTEDFYVRLNVSEAKRKYLVEDLKRQTALYEEERKKRDNLEKQLVLSIQSTQHQLAKTSTALFGRLETIRSSIDEISAEHTRDMGIKECLKALENIQNTRVLTMKEFQKAEGMLRFVHERIDAGLEGFSEVLRSKQLQSEDTQAIARDQMQKLRTEVLKYEEVVAENRKVCESNVVLTMQLEAQQHHSRDLAERIKALQKSETDLALRSTQLERELSDLKDLTHSRKPESVELERKLDDLRQQLIRMEHELAATNSQVEQTEGHRQELEQEAAKYKAKYESAKEKLRETDAMTKQEVSLDQFDMMYRITNHYQTKNAADLRANILEDCQKSMRELESNRKNEIHHLTIERDEKENELKEQHKELSTAKEQLQTLRKTIKNHESELDKTRKEKTEIQAELENAQRKAEISSSKLTEAADLKEQVRQKTEQLESRTHDLAGLRRAYADLNSSVTDLQNSDVTLRSQLSQYVSTIDALRRENDRISEAQQNAQTTVRSAQNEKSALKKDNKDLSSLLEQARSDGTKMKSTQETFLVERDSLQQQLAEYRVAKDLNEAETRRIQAEAADEKRMCDAQCADLENLSLRLKESDTMLKEAEARLRLLDAEYHSKIESDGKAMENKIQLLHEEYDKKLRDVQTQTASIRQQQMTRSLALDEPSTRSSQSIHTGSNRRRVTRQNHSVLNVHGSSNTPHYHLMGTTNTIEREVPAIQGGESEFSFSLFEEESQRNRALDDFIDDHDLSIVDPAAEAIDETQEMGVLSIEDLAKQTRQTPQHETNSQNSSLTDLSTISSEEMSQMQMDVQHLSPSLLRGRDHGSSTYEISQESGGDAWQHAGSSSSQSHNRPKSKANTASRIMPPPETSSPQVMRHNQALDPHVLTTGDLAQQPRGIRDRSSPVLINPGTTAKHTYGNSGSQFLGSSDDNHSPRRKLDKSPARKRKPSISQTEQDKARKKQRTSVPAYPLGRSSGSRGGSIRSHALESGSKMPLDLSYPPDSTTSASRSPTKASSSSRLSPSSSRVSHANATYQPRQQELSPSQALTDGRTRRSSSRFKNSSGESTAFSIPWRANPPVIGQRNDRAAKDRFDHELRRRK
ncbi:hypothetical protein N0V83_000830 [Neocucurbitaria cava]|uniref:Uncharacterized protein n=1 Tax=Neocucurbitaria cava TaxID=798079 RepID=A0A9W8YK67_9PLEO|nr:hypothetical protein N0V83_000830 [Neocucurbitaria cava]